MSDGFRSIAWSIRPTRQDQCFFLKKRSIVSLVIAFSLLVAAMAALVILFDRQTRDAAAVQYTLIVQTHLSRVLSLLQDAETGQRGYLLCARRS